MTVDHKVKSEKPSTEEMSRYEELFHRLDANKDGKIEASELAAALSKTQQISKKQASSHAQKIISKANQDDDQHLDFSEFIDYMMQHEKDLRLAFSDLDKNNDGLIEPSEVQAAMIKLGMNVDIAEAERLTKRLDQDGNLKLDWQEWRDFLELCPSGDLEDIVKYWRSARMIDIGENMTIPTDFTEKEKKTGMWWRHLVAGGMAGAVSRTFTAPLDRLKILLQVHGAQSKLGIVSGFQHMIKEGGWKSLWRGNGTNVLKIAPESAIKFAAYEQIKNIVKGDKKEVGVIERFAAGSTAGAFAQTCIYPMEVIKTRLAVMKTGQYKGILDCGVKIFKHEGPKALFKGYIPNLIGIIPYAGIDLTIYETLKQMYLRNNPQTKDPGVMVLLACGTMSSTCGQLASYPLALIRTRLQAQATPEAAKGNFVSLTQHILKTDGVRGLYRGILPNFMKVLPAVSISYVIYEKTKESLKVN